MKRKSALVGLVFIAIACNSSPGGPTLRLQAPLLDVIAGDRQTDTVMRELPTAIAVQVTDAKSASPLAQVLVNWVVIQGGGQIFAGAALTDAQGIARERWTLGPRAGEQLLEARAVDAQGNAVVFTRATATAKPDVAVSLHSSPTGRGLYGSVPDTIVMGDSGAVVQYFYQDRFNNAGALCPDGTMGELTWSSRDSSIAIPSGRTTFVPNNYFGWVRGIGVGETVIDIIAGCIAKTSSAGIIVVQ